MYMTCTARVQLATAEMRACRCHVTTKLLYRPIHTFWLVGRLMPAAILNGLKCRISSCHARGSAFGHTSAVGFSSKFVTLKINCIACMCAWLTTDPRLVIVPYKVWSFPTRPQQRERPRPITKSASSARDTVHASSWESQGLYTVPCQRRCMGCRRQSALQREGVRVGPVRLQRGRERL